MSEEVRKMFADISGKYDLMNTILSFGIHHKWRRKTIKEADLKGNEKVLDCATGTGDLAFAFKYNLDNNSQVIGTDFCEDMLVIAREKAAQKNADVKFEFADVMNLQFEDNYFDVSSISFGIRNVDVPAKGISEMARVVKSGGRVLILEFGQPDGWFKMPYNVYSKYIMPFLGKLFAGDKSAYTYLPVTASKFPAGDKFVEIMKTTHSFKDVKAFKLTFGVAYLYVGIVK